MRPDLPLVLSRVEAAVRASSSPLRLVAVDGPAGSGKSTLARPLVAHLDAPLIRIDDFVTWRRFGAWWPRFDQQVLQPLLAGRDASYQQRDWHGDEFGDGLAGWRTVPWAPVVVLEGVTCSRRAIAAHLASRIWIEAPAADRLARGLLRDGESHRGLWERWMVEEDAFFAEDGARARADLVVQGTG